MTYGMLNGKVENGYVFDRCHDQLKPGDVIIADYRGRPNCQFEVLRDTGSGMFQFRDPDGVERPMRPSTMLNVATRIIRA